MKTTSSTLTGEPVIVRENDDAFHRLLPVHILW